MAIDSNLRALKGKYINHTKVERIVRTANMDS